MANGTEKTKKGTKISERAALNAQGEDVANYTEAVKAQYKHLASGIVMERDFTHIADGVDRAFAIEGYITKVGHAVNKAMNGPNANGDVKAALEEFQQTIDNGEWTNREGGSEPNLGAVQQAYADLTKTTLEAVQAKWTEFDEATRKAIRVHPHVKAGVARIQLAKAEALAAASDQAAALPPMPA